MCIGTASYSQIGPYEAASRYPILPLSYDIHWGAVLKHGTPTQHGQRSPAFPGISWVPYCEVGQLSRRTTPAEAFPPGEYLRDELEERGWTVSEFARTLGWPVQTLTNILDGKSEITADAARALSNVLGTTAEVWLNLQKAYRRYQLRATSGSGI